MPAQMSPDALPMPALPQDAAVEAGPAHDQDDVVSRQLEERLVGAFIETAIAMWLFYYVNRQQVLDEVAIDAATKARSGLRGMV